MHKRLFDISIQTSCASLSAAQHYAEFVERHGRTQSDMFILLILPMLLFLCAVKLFIPETGSICAGIFICTVLYAPSTYLFELIIDELRSRQR